MLIDRTHRPWIVATAAALAVAAAAYVPYSLLSVRGASGGSPVGIIYGSVGSALMVFAGLLGARKKVPTWRIGRGTTWMRGHLWLGLASFPFILFHAGFRLGAGSLTRTLMVLFIIVIASGVFGAVLQHFVPRTMTDRVPLESIYDQIDRLRGQLIEEAGRCITELCGALEADLAVAGELQRAQAAGAGTIGSMTFASALGADETVSATIREFSGKELQPFLAQRGGRGRALADPATAKGMFRQLRVFVPEALWSHVGDLESITEEKRQLDAQRRLHLWLHGWLLVHIPISYAVLALGAIHAVLALRY